jgi:hypothetical protein
MNCPANQSDVAEREIESFPIGNPDVGYSEASTGTLKACEYIEENLIDELLGKGIHCWASFFLETRGGLRVVGVWTV